MNAFLFLLGVCGFTVCGFLLALIYGLLFVIAVGFDALYVNTIGLLLADFALCGERPALASAQGLDPKAL